ncbi:MAG: hypothetical protein J7K66_07340 [Anaerolineaceae bacterium]|nr:hypothetical protein [Anaerolineaceae bacterium]
MKYKNFALVTTLIIISGIIGSCTRSASGGPSDAAVENSELPNPVSTQSQLMKDIISGTQTAMAAPLEATVEAPADDDGEETAGESTAEATPEPDEEEVILPTSTAGPPPVIELTYNSNVCPPGYYICEKSNVKDQTITMQSSHPYLYGDENLTFKMGPEGEYDYSKYIVVGTAKYEPNPSQGLNFQVTLTVPDSLRGQGQIVVRLETIDPNRYGMFYYDNN